jgi:hypothetical protein
MSSVLLPTLCSVLYPVILCILRLLRLVPTQASFVGELLRAKMTNENLMRIFIFSRRVMIITKEVYAYVSPHFLLATPVEVEGVSSAK